MVAEGTTGTGEVGPGCLADMPHGILNLREEMQKHFPETCDNMGRALVANCTLEWHKGPALLCGTVCVELTVGRTDGS
jgi:hypothetical protein